MKVATSVLAALGRIPATTAQLVERMPGVCVPSALATLRERGLVTSVQGVHQITDKGRAWVEAGVPVPMGPRPGQAGSRAAGTLRAKAWRYLRIKRKAGMDDLLFLVADGNEKDAEANLRRYLTALERAGVLIRTRSGWLLPSDRNTGPEAPSWNSKTKAVIDVNTGEQWTIG